MFKKLFNIFKIKRCKKHWTQNPDVYVNVDCHRTTPITLGQALSSESLNTALIELSKDVVINGAYKEYKDERGKISSLVEGIPFQSVLKITSKAGTTRARHVHKEDYHLCVLTKGKMNYYEKRSGKIKKYELKTGDIFYTAPGIPHEMEFTKNSEFWCFSKLSREQDNYESDTTRLNYSLVEKYNKEQENKKKS